MLLSSGLDSMVGENGENWASVQGHKRGKREKETEVKPRERAEVSGKLEGGLRCVYCQ